MTGNCLKKILGRFKKTRVAQLTISFVLVFVFNGCQFSDQQGQIFSSGKKFSERQLLITLTNSPQAETQMLNSFSADSYQPNYNASFSTRYQILQLQRDYPITEVDGWTINALGVYCALFNLHIQKDTASLIKKLRNDPRVESVQPLYQYTVQTDKTSYNDPYFQLQYQQQENAIAQLHQWSTGKNVSIAIVDTGADSNHSELEGQLAGTKNFVDNDKKQFTSDIHGTAMAGIIAAKADNGIGIVGLAPDAKLWLIKACWQLKAYSSAATCNSFTLVNALGFAIDRKIDIINLSLSGPPDPLVARVIEKAIANGQIIIAADPVEGENRYPALLPGVIAARQYNPVVSSLSHQDKKLVVSGESRDVLSIGPDDGYDFFRGSSVTTALSSGYAALLHQRNKSVSPLQRTQFLNHIYASFVGKKPLTLAGFSTSPTQDTVTN